MLIFKGVHVIVISLMKDAGDAITMYSSVRRIFNMELKQEKPELDTVVSQTDEYAAPKADGTQQGESEWGRYAGWSDQSDSPYVNSGGRMSKAEFYKQPALKKNRSNITACAVVAYFCAACTFIVNVVLAHNIFGMVDVCLLLGLGLGIHLGKSRVCAIILLVYAGINTIYILLIVGRFGGYLILLCGIYAVIETFKIQKAWKEYELTGRV